MIPLMKGVGGLFVFPSLPLSQAIFFSFLLTVMIGPFWIVIGMFSSASNVEIHGNDNLEVLGFSPWKDKMDA